MSVEMLPADRIKMDSAQARLDELSKAPVRTEWDEIAHRYVLIIDGVGSNNSKGMQWEARCEATATGVRWVLSGGLAKAVDLLCRQRTPSPHKD